MVAWEQRLARQHAAAVAAASAAPLHIEHDSIHIALGDTPDAMFSPTMARSAATHYPAPTAGKSSESVAPGGVHLYASSGRGTEAAGTQTHADRPSPSLPSPCAGAPAGGGGGVCSVVVGAHVGGPEALAVAGCLALQALMLGVDRPHLGPHFHTVSLCHIHPMPCTQQHSCQQTTAQLAALPAMSIDSPIASQGGNCGPNSSVADIRMMRGLEICYKTYAQQRLPIDVGKDKVRIVRGSRC